MSEPRTAAGRVEEVVPGVWSWSVHDDRIDFVSTAHAVGDGDEVVLIDREGGVAFVPDLFTHVPERGLRTVWDEYMHDPAEARRSIEKLLELPFSVLCLDHGAPVTDDPKGAIRALLVSAS